ncbi:UNVERIFIED_ORG: O-antigen/teichoic acid export membrane protein [Pseudomonas parafulva]|jgi:O-antigen/teichoic acid export membrane protein|uniref:Oligosaccharide flippase family protein n=1 Tax=Pseudomonas fulva TaxID=47880 RepID=A0A2L1WDL3_9PSED|nr:MULTISPECIES: oligosaccharide flippase family protein [Pseudomonas]MDP9554986.1 O-antigen/teichoic acid export membrane protein [Pseudomonas parafulva]AVF55519.1 polysaccharide biosynthesis protein [Pseudomonas fulva]MBA1209088.1 oligosaccharide flippase family protein [Pseudomonas fulva]MBA1218499.1 oligosaccharide flippase family protein [Pseudomonas fulva]MBA1223197.1 oligosaccharide flippase family protein [Pseudomonas fulva]
MPSIEVSATASLRSRALRAGSWNLVSQVASQLMRLGGNLIMARILVPEMFGVMVIATTVSVLLHLLSDVGLRQNIIQSHRGDDPVFLNTAWTVQIIRGFILFALTLLLALGAWLAQVAELWPADATYAAPVLPAVLAITGLSAVIWGFQSTKIDVAVRTFQQKRVVLVDLASQVAGLLVMLVVGYLTHSIWALVSAGLVSALAWTVLGHTALEGPGNRLHWDRAALNELIVFGRWILLSSMVGVLAMYGDRIWFGASMTAAQLGVYSIAVLILGAVQMAIMKVVGAVALPAFSEAARADDRERLVALYHRFRLLVDLLVLFICGGFLTASPLLIGWMYDERYREAGPMLAILSLSFLTLRYTLAHQVWIALGLTKYQAMDNIIRLVSLWGLLPVLLYFGGVDWAIWGVALHTLPTLVLIVYVNSKLGMFSLKRELVVLPALLAGALCGAGLTALFEWI